MSRVRMPSQDQCWGCGALLFGLGLLFASTGSAGEIAACVADPVKTSPWSGRSELTDLNAIWARLDQDEPCPPGEDGLSHLRAIKGSEDSYSQQEDPRVKAERDLEYAKGLLAAWQAIQAQVAEGKLLKDADGLYRIPEEYRPLVFAASVGGEALDQNVAKVRAKASSLEKLLAGMIERPPPNLTALERAVLGFYTGNGYMDLNRALRAGGLAAECMRPFTEALSLVLQKFPVYSGVVWRGMSQLPTGLGDGKEPLGKSVRFAAFSSTARDSTIAKHFSGTQGYVLQIQSKSCRDISALNPDEQEVICLPGSEFQVIARDGDRRLILTEKAAGDTVKGTLEERVNAALQAAPAKPKFPTTEELEFGGSNGWGGGHGGTHPPGGAIGGGLGMPSSKGTTGPSGPAKPGGEK